MPPELGRDLAKMPPGRLGSPLEYPSKDYWILEQIALWLTLGKVQDFSHGQFPMADVLQNGEFMMYRSYRSKCTVVHYFRGNEDLFWTDADTRG